MLLALTEAWFFWVQRVGRRSACCEVGFELLRQLKETEGNGEAGSPGETVCERGVIGRSGPQREPGTILLRGSVRLASALKV